MTWNTGKEMLRSIVFVYWLNVFWQRVYSYVVRRKYSHRWSVFMTPLNINLTSVGRPDFERRAQAMCSRIEQFHQAGRDQIAHGDLGHVQMYNTKPWITYYVISYSAESKGNRETTSVSKSKFVIRFQLKKNSFSRKLHLRFVYECRFKAVMYITSKQNKYVQ